MPEAKGKRGSQLDGTTQFGIFGRDALLRLIEFREDLHRTLVKDSAGLGQRQAPGRTMQQPAAQMTFQLADPPADHGFRHAEPFAGGYEATGLYNCDKGFDIGKLVHIVAKYRTNNSITLYLSTNAQRPCLGHARGERLYRQIEEITMNQTTMTPAIQMTGRVLMSAIFVMAGISKLGSYAATQGYMESTGVPGILLPLVILLELGGGLTVLLGWQTRISAFLLAGFCIVSALIFHANFGEQMQTMLFMKNLAMAGGFLFLVAGGAGAWSLDARRQTSR
jgi:putative oxidoreductase